MPVNATTTLAAPAPAKRPTLLAELAGKWDGHVVRKASKGPGVSITGTARFLGTNVGSRCYAVTFSDGTEQRLTQGAVEKLRVGRDVSILTAAVHPAVSPKHLPARWLLDTYDHVRKCLTTLAPGYWTEGHVTGLLMQTTLFSTSPALSYQPANASECVRLLVQSVVLPSEVTDVWPTGSQWLQDALRTQHVTVQHPGSALAGLSPACYVELSGKPVSNQVRVFVGSPSVHVTDMVLLLGALHLPDMIAVLVPTTYHTHAPPARSAALSRFGDAGRMVVLPCPLGDGDILVHSAWILVFKDSLTKSRMMAVTTPSIPNAVA